MATLDHFRVYPSMKIQNPTYRRLPRCALDMNVIFTLDNIVLVPIVSRPIAKNCGGKQDKDLLFMSSSTLSVPAV